MNTISILGSCVTRDVFEITSHSYTINKYFARTSIISLMSKPIMVAEKAIALQSNFQRRCVYNDLRKTFFERISEEKSDWFIIDLIDERFNILQIGESYITKSNELVASKWAAEQPHVELKRTRDMLQLWEKSAKSFFTKLLTIYEPSQIILHKTTWKHKYYDSEGNVHEFLNMTNSINYQNEMLQHYYSYIEKNYPDIQVIDMTKEPYLSSEQHKWGLSPYHFENEYYECFQKHFQTLTEAGIPNYTQYETKLGQVNLMMSYDSQKTYLDLAIASHIHQSKKVQFDETGIPFIKVDGKKQYSPITIGIYGLEFISKYYKTKQQGLKETFLNICSYLLKEQQADGSWPVNFDYHYEVKESGMCKAPWVSALAQGFAISCLVRAHHLTQNTSYLISATKAVAPFYKDIEDGGVRRTLFNQFVFYEEYPTEKPTHILNSFMFSLLGLYDLYATTKDREVLQLYKQGVHTLVHTVSMYDLGNVSSYDLTHLTIPGNPSKYHYGYHLTHVKQLSAINQIEQNEILEKVMQRWLTYAQGNKSCFRLEEKYIQLLVNDKKELILIKGEENRICVKYDLDESLEYAFYVNLNNERVWAKGYSSANEFIFIPTEDEYSILAFVRDQFGNAIVKEVKLAVINSLDTDLDFPKKVEDITTLSLQNNKIVVTVGTEKIPHFQFAYYVQREKQIIHKQWYSDKQQFEYLLETSGHYEVIVFCLNAANEKFSFTKKVNYKL